MMQHSTKITTTTSKPPPADDATIMMVVEIAELVVVVALLVVMALEIVGIVFFATRKLHNFLVFHPVDFFVLHIRI